jgi:hypothetical protein
MESSVKTKVCPRCGERKVVEEYHKNKRLKDGLDTYCKECKSKRKQTYHIKNKETIKEHYTINHLKNREK